MAEPRILGIVLAGGEGKRLAPLTDDRAKPAVPFAGLYRLIDFALSNLVNAGVLKIAVLTQYKSHSLDRHITTTWRLSNLLGNYVTPGAGAAAARSALVHRLGGRDLPVAEPDPRRAPRHRRSSSARTTSTAWTRGRCGSQHLDGGAGVTVAGIPVPRREASAFGVIQTADDGRKIEAFLEKPADPPGLPGRPDETFASMGNYVFSTEALLDALHTDAAERGQQARHGRRHRPDAHRAERGAGLRLPVQRGARRDRRRRALLARRRDDRLVLRLAHGPLRRWSRRSTSTTSRWPILTHIPSRPPAKFVHNDGDRVGKAIDSIVSNGVIVSGASVRESVLSPGRAPAQLGVGRAVGADGRRGRRSAGRRAQRDPRQERPVADGVEIGVDKDEDRARGFAVSEAGVTVVGKGVEVLK